MSKNDFQEFICRPYCMFFKDGKKEEMACRGAQVVELLAQKKQINRITIPPLTKNPGLWDKYREELGSHVCRHCSFQTEDCDFQSAEPPDDAEPCGGFILLAHLRENNLINASDLEQCCEG